MPRKFIFKLQKLEEVRRLAVRERRARVALLRLRVEHEQQKLRQLASELEQLREEMLQVRKQPSTLALHLPYEEYRERMKRRVALAQRELAQREEELARLRAALAEANRDLKVVEKVHERKLEEHIRELLSAEQKELDEQGFLRRSQ